MRHIRVQEEGGKEGVADPHRSKVEWVNLLPAGKFRRIQMQQQQMSNAGEVSNFGSRRMWRPNNSGGATKICHLGEVYWIRRKSQKRQDPEDDDDLVRLLLLTLHLSFLLPKMTNKEKRQKTPSPLTSDKGRTAICHQGNKAPGMAKSNVFHKYDFRVFFLFSLCSKYPPTYPNTEWSI